jgi:hypothetical protein
MDKVILLKLYVKFQDDDNEDDNDDDDDNSNIIYNHTCGGVSIARINRSCLSKCVIKLIRCISLLLPGRMRLFELHVWQWHQFQYGCLD